MRRSPWSVSVVGLTVACLAVVGGTAIGADLGPLSAGSGLLIVLAALYAIALLVIRERAWRRLGRSRATFGVETVAGHRLF